MAKQAVKKNGKKQVGKQAAKGKAMAKPKANGGAGHKPEGITAFMLRQLQTKPHTVKELAEAANKQFPDHPVPALTNTARGLLARIEQKGFKAEHDSKAKTYQISPK